VIQGTGEQVESLTRLRTVHLQIFDHPRKRASDASENTQPVLAELGPLADSNQAILML
jgi:hypothetical protein